jgi:hypothetical protein
MVYLTVCLMAVMLVDQMAALKAVLTVREKVAPMAI